MNDHNISLNHSDWLFFQTWNHVICNKDSDGDGISNGEELGDPDCKWSPGKTSSRTSGLSHPGKSYSVIQQTFFSFEKRCYYFFVKQLQ